MANELNITLSLAYTKNGLNEAVKRSNLFRDLAGDGFSKNVQAVATTWESLDLGDIAADSVRYAYFQNLDETNNIQLALDNAGAQIFATLQPGDVALIPVETGTLFAQANGAESNLFHALFEK